MMIKKFISYLEGLPATIVGGLFLVLSLVMPKLGVSLPVDPAWVTVIISGIPLLYLAVSRIIYNPGISKISSALLITIAMIAAICIGSVSYTHLDVYKRQVCSRLDNVRYLNV